MEINGNCGSHCEDYGVVDPDDRQGETFTIDFCDMSDIEQPLSGRKAECPPEKGWAMMHSLGYIMPMFINAPVSISLLMSVSFRFPEGELI
jgi:hypothetical protein